MNWTAVIIGMLVFLLMAAITTLAHVFDLLDEVRAQNDTLRDMMMILRKPWHDDDLKYLKGSNIEHGIVKGEWV